MITMLPPVKSVQRGAVAKANPPATQTNRLGYYHKGKDENNVNCAMRSMHFCIKILPQVTQAIKKAGQKNLPGLKKHTWKNQPLHIT